MSRQHSNVSNGLHEDGGAEPLELGELRLATGISSVSTVGTSTSIAGTFAQVGDRLDEAGIVASRNERDDAGIDEVEAGRVRIDVDRPHLGASPCDRLHERDGSGTTRAGDQHACAAAAICQTRSAAWLPGSRRAR